jgi:hypothetical protein
MLESVPRRLDGPADTTSNGDIEPRGFFTAPCRVMPELAKFKVKSATLDPSELLELSWPTTMRSLAARLSLLLSLIPLTVVSRLSRRKSGSERSLLVRRSLSGDEGMLSSDELELACAVSLVIWIGCLSSVHPAGVAGTVSRDGTLVRGRRVGILSSGTTRLL